MNARRPLQFMSLPFQTGSLIATLSKRGCSADFDNFFSERERGIQGISERNPQVDMETRLLPSSHLIGAHESKNINTMYLRLIKFIEIFATQS
jgi:hypothetical protein